MYVKLKDGTVKCVTNEIDIAEIVEEYCGSDLAELIRECDHTNIVHNCFDALEELAKANMEEDLDDIFQHIEDAELLLREYL